MYAHVCVENSLTLMAFSLICLINSGADTQTHALLTERQHGKVVAR